MLGRPLPRVVMHLLDDTTVEGLLKSSRGEHYLLIVPRLLAADETHAIQCDAYAIPKRNVRGYEIHGVQR